ncbi:MAG: hypothetical protein QW560_02045 [Candidatus Nitrosocaldus sp.]
MRIWKCMLICSLLYLLTLPVESYTYPEGYTNYIILNLSIMPEIIEYGGKASGFIYLTDVNGKPVLAEDDVRIQLSHSSDIVSIPDEVVIKANDFYTVFEIETKGIGEANITAVSNSTLIHQQNITKSLKIVEANIQYSQENVEDIRVEIESLTGNFIMLTDSELPLLIVIKDSYGRYIPAPHDLQIKLSYSTELITLEYNPYIPKGSSYMIAKVTSYNLSGIAYLTAKIDIDGKEVVTSTSISITSDRASRLEIYVMPPIIGKGFMPIDILIITTDSNGVPVPADRDIIVKVTSSSPSLSKLDENSALSKYIIRKGEYSISIREYGMFTSTGRVSISVSASGMVGTSATLDVVEPLMDNNKKIKERVLKLFMPENIAERGIITGVYQSYAVEYDEDDCPLLQDITIQEGMHVGMVDISSIVDECKNEGYIVHNIDLLDKGGLYPISNVSINRAYVTISNTLVDVVANNVVNNMYGVITIKSNGSNNRGGDVTVTVNLQGVGNATSTLHIVGNRIPDRTITLLHETRSEYHIFVTTVEYGNRPVRTNMQYIVNPIATKLEMEGSSYTMIVIPKDSIRDRRLSIMPIGIDVDDTLAVHVELPNDSFDVKLMFPFTTIVPIKNEYRIGYIQLFKDGMIYTATSDINIKITSSSDNVIINNAIVRKGSSYAQFTLTISNLLREDNVKLSIPDKGIETEINIVLLDLDEPNIIAYSNDINDSIEVRIYTRKGANIVWKDTSNYIEKDDNAIRVDGKGFYARALLKPYRDVQLDIVASIVAPGYRIYNINQSIYEFIPYAERDDNVYGALNLSVKRATLYAGITGYIEVVVNDSHGNPVSMAKVNVYGGDDVEILTNTLYTNDDGIARIFIKTMKDSTLNIDVSKAGYTTLSIQVPITVRVEQENDGTKMDMVQYILMSTSIGGVASILAFILKSRRNNRGGEEE